MGKHTKQFHKLNNEFYRAGIPTSTPGFYDHAKFLDIEQGRPDAEYLDQYARFVHWRSYDAAYLERAEKIVRIVSEELHRGLLEENRLGGCMDTSMAMSRILDRHGAWNYIVRGALRIIFPAGAAKKPFNFWPVAQDDGTGKEPGHKWVYAPPFCIVDLTLRLQEYEDNTADFLPDTVLVTSATPVKGDPEDILNPALIAVAARRGQNAKEALASIFPKYVSAFAADFSAYVVEGEKSQLKYVPIGVGASIEPLEEIRSYSVQGRTAYEFYETDIKPKLVAAGL